MNKKGQIAAALSDFAWYGGFIIIIVIFFFLFKLAVHPSAKANQILEQDFPQIREQQFLLNYLRGPITVEGRQITMADYIVISYESKQQSALEHTLRSDFDKFVKTSGLECYYLQIIDSQQKTVISIYDNEPSPAPACRNPFSFDPVLLPTHTGQLSLRLSVTKTKNENIP